MTDGIPESWAKGLKPWQESILVHMGNGLTEEVTGETINIWRNGYGRLLTLEKEIQEWRQALERPETLSVVVFQR